MPNEWNESNLRTERAVANPGPGMIAAVSRMSNTIDIFWIAPDGSINNARWYDVDDRKWESSELFAPGTASATGGIAAITRSQDTIEIFWIGPTGTVQQARWAHDERHPTGAWEIFALASAGSASTTAGVAAVSRRPDTKEVFWVAPNATLRNAHWYESSKEWHFAQVSDNAAVDSHVTAVARNADNLDVVYSQVVTVMEPYAWEPIYYANPYYDWTKTEKGYVGHDDNWQPQYLPTGQFLVKTKPVSRYSLVVNRWSDDTTTLKGIWRRESLYYTKTLSAAAAVCRNSKTIEIFYVEHGEALHHSFWYEGESAWQHSALTPPGEASTSAGVTATARKSGTIEVMWISPQGGVNNAFWYEGHPWVTYHLTGPGAAANTGDITLISRIPESLEAFWVDPAGKVANRHWYE